MRPRLVPELICSDFELSLAFYTNVLGFTVKYARPEERFAMLEREGAELMVEQPLAQDRLWPNAELARPYGRGINLEIQVGDIDALKTAVVAAGVPFFLLPEERWYRRDNSEIGVRQFAIQDPDGYLLRFSQMIGTRATSHLKAGADSNGG
jgi:lactoylglutathione lyase